MVRPRWETPARILFQPVPRPWAPRRQSNENRLYTCATTITYTLAVEQFPHCLFMLSLQNSKRKSHYCSDAVITHRCFPPRYKTGPVFVGKDQNRGWEPMADIKRLPSMHCNYSVWQTKNRASFIDMFLSKLILKKNTYDKNHLAIPLCAISFHLTKTV